MLGTRVSLADWGSAPGPTGREGLNYRNQAEHKSSSNKKYHFLRFFVPGVLIALFSLIKNFFFLLTNIHILAYAGTTTDGKVHPVNEMPEPPKKARNPILCTESIKKDRLTQQ